jgi:type II secretory pathway component PulF
LAITLARTNPVAEAEKAKESSSVSAQGRRGFSNPFRKKVSTGELVFFNSQLSLMLEIGISLTNALKAVADQTKNIAFQEIVLAMLKDIEEGKQFSEAMSRYPEIFSSVFISMVKAGETGGFLKKSLDGIIVMQEKRQNLLTELRSTLAYPLVLCVMSVGVVIFVLVGILPKFTVLFAGKESILPFTTRTLMAASVSLRTYWWAHIGAFAAAFTGLYLFLRSYRGRALIDRILVTTPFLEKLANKIYTCQLLRTLGNLLESRVTLVYALTVTQATFSNRYYTEFVEQIRQSVEQGGRFSHPFASNPLIMESVKQMISTAEEVGNLPKVMLRLALFYDGEVERELKTVGSMIEPIALVFLGGVVAMIVSSVVLPIFKIAGAMH